MVLSKSELIASLQHEVHVLLHLAGKIDRAQLDYRPTPKQRSTLELLRYLSFMGPVMIESAKRGTFDPALWNAAEQPVKAADFDQAVATIATLRDAFATSLGAWSDDDFRVEIEMFGRTSTRGAFIVSNVLNAHAAYRMQLFLYLKACGREELNTMNLWAGIDAPMP